MMDSSVGLISGHSEKSFTGKGCVIRKIKIAGTPQGAEIGKIAGSFSYVRYDDPMENIVKEWRDIEDVYSLGVVDEEGRPLGIIVKRELMDILGQPYGRELHITKTAERMMRRVRSFDFNKNLFSVSEQISADLYNPGNTYYLLTTGEERFGGIFSTRDMLIYLSKMSTSDITLATRLQACIVKEETFFSETGFEILGASRMAKGVGGDFYSIEKYNSDRWVFSICDVSGKGISASLISMTIGGMLSIWDMKNGLDTFIGRLNRYIINNFESGRFITGVFMDFNPENRKITVYDMGHSYIYLHREGRINQIRTKCGCPPLGIEPSLNPVGAVLSLKKEDLLIVITDGIEEQTDTMGTPFSIRRVGEIIQRERGNGVKAIKKKLFDAIDEHRKNQTIHDDMTLVMLDYMGE